MIIRLDPDPAGTGGGAADTKTDPPAPDLAKAVEEVLKKHGGDQSTAIRTLLAEHSAKDARIAELSGKLPKEGHHVIDPDTHKLFGSYQALGKPEDLTKALEAGTAAATELATIKRAQHFAEVAGLHGYEASVLTTLAEKDGLEIEIQETDGKDKLGKAIKVKTAVVKTADDKFVPLTDHAEKAWKAFLPALKPAAATDTKTVLRGSPTGGNTNPPRPPINPQDKTQDRTVRRPNLL